MLTRLYVKDFAIAAEVDFDLGAGLGVISGETGAGKSLLVDALLLLSGGRADAGMVRHGQARAELVAQFQLDDAPAALAWLRENELDQGQDCQLRRVIRADGGSRAWINGSPATLAQLGELAEMLVGIHGQHEHQALLDRQQQTALLDSFGDHAVLLGELKAAHAVWREARRALEQLQAGGDPGERIDLLQHQLRELGRHPLDPAHIDQLLAAHKRQSAAADILAGMDEALRLLSDESSAGARTGLRQALLALQRAQRHDASLDEAVALLDSAAIQLDEAASSIERHHDGFELDPEALRALEAELGHLHELGRKHRCGLHDLQQRASELAAELDRLEHAGQHVDAAQARMDAALACWRAGAAKLSTARAQAAQRLGREVGTLMQELGMGGGVLEVRLDALDEREQPHPLGAERVELCVSANAGQPPRPLRKVASGGELARISLAIEVATLGADAIPSMVFDEVDSGIGGATAEVVGQKLRTLGAARQVLCVTHLAQVAAQGHYHYRVSKAEVEGVTRSRIERLDEAARVDELARMIGGVEITEATLAHARQMLQRAQHND